jgi:di/tricarboxylate transporter
MDATGGLSGQAWLSLAVAGGTLVAVASGRVASDLAFVTATLLLLFAGVLDAEAALAGFANRGVLTIAALFVVARALDHSGSLGLLSGGLLRWRGGQRGAMLRLLPPVALGSAFLNNTPLVALLLPVVTAWCDKLGLAASKLLIPLSYAAILGGLCTLIGTSTNMLVAGMWSAGGHGELGLFSITALGVPVALAGLLYLWLAGPQLLPDRGPALAEADHPYATLRRVTPGGPLAGKPATGIVDDHAMPLLPVEVARGGEVIAAPGGQLVLQGGDVLAFAGPSAALLELHGCPGLEPIDIDQTPLPGSGRPEIHELVIDATCPLLGHTVGDGSFRARYDAAVLALARGGESVDALAQGWRLAPGDLVLVEARPGFVQRHGRGDGVWVVASHGSGPAESGKRAWGAVLVMLAMVIAAAVEVGPLAQVGMLESALAAAVLLVLGGWLPISEARRAIDLHVLVTIAGALALGTALTTSGAAQGLAGLVVDCGAGSPWLSLALVYLVTVAATEVITNNAAAALMFPIALASADRLAVSPLPFLFALMVAASASFATPLGYQTNLMVAGPGHYRFSDFLRIGLPMAAVVAVVTLALTPLIWPF